MFTVWCDLVALNFKKARLCQGRHIRLRLVRVKVFSERKMFSCVWLHFKKCFGKYFLMFGCVLENTIENTFSTCLLIFSHIFSITKWIYNIIHSSKHKQNPEKKIIKSEQTKARSRLRSRSVRSRSSLSRSHEASIAIAIKASRNCDRNRRFAQCVDRDHDRRRSAQCRWSRGGVWDARWSAFGSLIGVWFVGVIGIWIVLSLSLSLRLVVCFRCFGWVCFSHSYGNRLKVKHVKWFSG